MSKTSGVLKILTAVGMIVVAILGKGNGKGGK